MEAGDWALVACVVFSGVWFGFLCMLTLILHPILKARDLAGFRGFLGEFLPIARKAWFNYVCVTGLIISPAVALWTLESDTTPFTLTVFGLALTAIGPLGVSNRLAEPNYDAILGWDPNNPPEGWEKTQSRYYLYNWIRFACTGAAFALFLAALVDQLN
jgi:hypothetical protein